MAGDGIAAESLSLLIDAASLLAMFDAGVVDVLDVIIAFADDVELIIINKEIHEKKTRNGGR